MAGVRRGGKGGRPRAPLTAEALRALALHYVGKYATTRAKLGAYLRRKVQERGWAEDREAPIEQLAEAFAKQGYVDDAGYALARSRALLARGYGSARVRQSLRTAGVGEEDGAEALELANADAADAALRFARRRRIGPFADHAADRAMRDKAVAAMVRAGHGFALARAIVALEPGSDPDLKDLF